MILPRSRRGNSLAELLVVLALLGLGVLLFWPRGEVDVAGYGKYGSAIILGIVAVGALLVCIAADWKIKRLALCLPLYLVLCGSTAYLVLTLSPRILQCAETLLH
jgi:CHASE2 domain-containing sensor protein